MVFVSFEKLEIFSLRSYSFNLLYVDKRCISEIIIRDIIFIRYLFKWCLSDKKSIFFKSWDVIYSYAVRIQEIRYFHFLFKRLDFKLNIKDVRQVYRTFSFSSGSTKWQVGGKCENGWVGMVLYYWVKCITCRGCEILLLGFSQVFMYSVV